MADGGVRGPLLRYPFLWAFLLGVIVLTLVRPCLRRVPAPPPATGRFPAVTLTDAHGTAIAPLGGAGSVRVVLYVRGACDAPCDGALARQRELQETYAAERVQGIDMLTVVAEQGADPARPGPAPATPDRLRAMAGAIGTAAPRWQFVTGDAAALAAVEAALLAGAAPPAPLRLAIVDAAGSLRGTYDPGADGFNEVYNRARHVHDASRSDG
jgi:cytochrome oxidase Cu insertion factor (SCO1/SenC/PrrC family)